MTKLPELGFEPPKDGLWVVAYDPGEKVGWASLEVRPGPEPPHQVGVLTHGILPLKDAALHAVEYAETVDLLIYETWRLSAKAARDLVGSDIPSIQFVGMLRLAAWQGGCKVRPQAPLKMSTARKTAPAWLQEILDREPARHDEAHNISALLHVWYYCWKQFVAKGTR